MIPIFVQTNGSQDNTVYSDYVIVAGQSQLDGREDVSNINPIYGGSLNNVKNFTFGGLVDWTAGSVFFTDEGVNKFAWDTYVLKDLADYYNKTIKAVKYTAGGTHCYFDGTQEGNTGKLGSWNPKYRLNLLSELINRINDIKRFEDIQGKKARFVCCFWHQGAGDAVAFYNTEYANFTNTKLRGNFIDVMRAIRSASDNPNLPFFIGQLEALGSEFRQSVAEQQKTVSIYDENAYILLINELSIADEPAIRYPKLDSVHFNEAGISQIRTDFLPIIIQSGVFDNYQE